MKKLSLTVVVLCSGAVSTFAQERPERAADAVTLEVGDPAPPVVVEKWLKGEPLDLDDGKVHVVEFWATWCGPCKLAMPHLSELAAKYAGKVSFAGISIWENGDDYMPRVERFVHHANASMAYGVAAGGGRAAEMGKTWMRAAGRNGIPATFVVDRRGRIAWMGHPMIGLDEALALAVDDKLDAAAEKKLAAELEARRKMVAPWRTEFLRAREEGDSAKVLELADEIVTNAPHMVVMVVPYQYVALTNTDPAAAAKFADAIVTKYANAPIVLSSVARVILDEESKIAGERDAARALRMIEQAEKCVEAGVELKRMRANALFRTGEVAKAIAEQKAAVAGARAELADAAQRVDDAEGDRAVRAAEAVHERANAVVEGLQRTLDEYERSASKTRQQ